MAVVLAAGAVRVVESRGDQYAELSSEYLGHCIAENPLCGRIEDGDPLILIDADDRVSSDRNDARELGFRFLECDLDAFHRRYVSDEDEEAAHYTIGDIGDVAGKAVPRWTTGRIGDFALELLWLAA